MSIKSTAFLGYSVDIQFEIESIEEKYKQALIYDEFDDIDNSEEYKNQLQTLNIVPFWDYSYRDRTNKFMIIRDGMDGKYTKLFFIIKDVPEVDIYDTATIDLFNTINEYLSNVVVSEELKKKFIEIYKFLFNKELDTTVIHLETFIHYS